MYSFRASDDGRWNRLKHVEHFAEINELCNVASCWLYLKIRMSLFVVTEKKTVGSLEAMQCSLLSSEVEIKI
jgi:hypothetical protein